MICFIFSLRGPADMSWVKKALSLIGWPIFGYTSSIRVVTVM